MKSNFYSKEFRLNNLYKIVNKEWQVIKFKLNKTQKQFFDLQKQYKRIVVLKARQLGLSTYKLIEWLDTALMYSNQTVIITAHQQNKLQELFEKVKFAYDNLPESIQLNDWKIWIKPKADYNNRNELFFKSNNSKIRVSLDSRSWTPTNLHITELAFMDRAKEMWTWSMPSIPSWAPVTVETTANWIGNFFYELWNKYHNKNDWEFKTVFFPWYDDEWYELEKDLDVPNELKHLEALWLDKKKINWYVNQYDILWREVFQEFPSTPEEAFLTTWTNFFNLNKLKQLPVLEYKEDLKYKDLRIYKPVCDDCIYWVDTAKWWLDWDLSVITVRNRNLELLASFVWTVPPDILWDIVVYIYELWYKCKWATIWIEINNTWISTIDKVKNSLIARYLYAQMVVDERTQKQSRKLWFNTNLKTRPLILNELEEWIRKNLIAEIDTRVKTDFMHFIVNDEWRPEAIKGKHDDWVMAEAICLHMLKQPKQIIFS